MSTSSQDTAPLSITPVASKGDMKAFLDLPYVLYNSDPNWHPPLRFERAAHISQKKNPGARNLDRALFLARRGGKVVGRIGAFINPKHQALYNDGAAHFGFFDCEKTPETGAALLDQAESWAREQGAKRLIGPSQHSVNEETGLLVDGFDTPAVLMMPHGRPDYVERVEAHGFTKAIDMLAFWAALHDGYPRPNMTRKMVDHARQNERITFRPLDTSRFKDEVKMAMSIFNDAWSENWGFLPFSDDQIQHMATELKPIIFREGFRIGMLDGEPVAFVCMVPNVNEATRDLNGRLLPFGWAKLLTRLKVTGVKSARIPLMGIRKELQNSRAGLSIVATLCEDVFAAARDKGFTHCELSWILETNKSMIRICEQASAVPYKTYRMYEKELT